jgi:hypothetical protein
LALAAGFFPEGFLNTGEDLARGEKKGKYTEIAAEALHRDTTAALYSSD